MAQGVFIYLNFNTEGNERGKRESPQLGEKCDSYCQTIASEAFYRCFISEVFQVFYRCLCGSHISQHSLSARRHAVVQAVQTLQAAAVFLFPVRRGLRVLV